MAGDAPPVFFAHGGYGSAGVWLEWMDHLHNAGYGGMLYAYSLRNHGASYPVSFLSMYFTSLNACAEDMLACFRYAQQDARRQDFVVVGHSSGGGLLQHALAKGDFHARALCLVDAIPHFGSYGVYWNWLKTDPWFPLRNVLHFQHPTSPLSSDRLVHQAFFGRQYRMANVHEFRRWMPPYESMGWPLGMFGQFWAWIRGEPKWLDPSAVVKNVATLVGRKESSQICIMAGSEDMMIDVGMCRLQAIRFRQAILLARRSASKSVGAASRHTSRQKAGVEGIHTEAADGVEVVVVQGAGHHVQNDVQCDKAARALQSFLEQV